MAWPTSTLRYSACASGGFSTIGISCQRATCLICSASRLQPFGHHHRRRHLRPILQRHGEVGGIGDDHGGALHVLQHAAPPHLPLQSAHPRLDRGIAVGLLVFVAQLLLAHAQIALQLLALQQVIDCRPQQQHQGRLPADLEGALIGELRRSCPAGICPARISSSQSRARMVTAEIEQHRKRNQRLCRPAPARRRRTSAPASWPDSCARCWESVPRRQRQSRPGPRCWLPPAPRPTPAAPAIQRSAASAGPDRIGCAGIEIALPGQIGPGAPAQRASVAAPRPRSTTPPAIRQSRSALPPARGCAPPGPARAPCRRRRGVACSVLSSFAMASSVRQLQQPLAGVNGAGEVAIENCRPVPQRERQQRKPDHALHRKSQKQHRQLRRSLAQKAQHQVDHAASPAAPARRSALPPARCRRRRAAVAGSCSPVASAVPAGR